MAEEAPVMRTTLFSMFSLYKVLKNHSRAWRKESVGHAKASITMPAGGTTRFRMAFKRSIDQTRERAEDGGRSGALIETEKERSARIGVMTGLAQREACTHALCSRDERATSVSKHFGASPDAICYSDVPSCPFCRLRLSSA
ncbi:hypothetical protein BHM03_00055031 [Ensete ventricosum]|nr:hypothetical protein BHM03_00055031 [Ensete ventricosum]